MKIENTHDRKVPPIFGSNQNSEYDKYITIMTYISPGKKIPPTYGCFCVSIRRPLPQCLPAARAWNRRRGPRLPGPL